MTESTKHDYHATFQTLTVKSLFHRTGKLESSSIMKQIENML